MCPHPSSIFFEIPIARANGCDGEAFEKKIYFPNRSKCRICRHPSSIFFENTIARADGCDGEAFGARNILLIIPYEVLVDACRIRDVAS